MNTILRATAALAVAVACVGSSGCKSNNEGLLEDTKWSSAYVPDFKGMSGRGVTMTLDFRGDGRFIMGVVGPAGRFTFTGKWKLGSFDYVQLYDLTPPLGGSSTHMEKVTVSGDTMTMSDSDGTKLVFTKIDKEMEKASHTPMKPAQTPASPNAEKDKPAPPPVWKSPEERRAEPIGTYK